MTEKFEEWTSCEFHGHNFETTESGARTCTDCGETYTP